MSLASPTHFRRPFLETLRDGETRPLADSINELTQRMQLTPEELALKIPAGTHLLVYDRVNWARWSLAKAGLVEIPDRGFTRITDRGLEALREEPEIISNDYLVRYPEFRDYMDSRKHRREAPDELDQPDASGNEVPEPLPDRHVWIEKTIVANRPDRQEGEYSVGKALWSPKQAKNGADIYRFMRDISANDVILHLTDNEAFTGVSEVETPARDFEGLAGTEWGEEPSYRVKLKNYTKLEPPLTRELLFSPPYRDRLLALISSGYKNLFYNKGPALNQGAYLTPAPAALVSILNDAYESVAARPLVEQSQDEGSNDGPLYINFFDSLVQSTYWTEAALGSIIDSIHHPVTPSRQIILAGPPGTSKTYVAQELIKFLTDYDPSRGRLVQFHPSYSYEQFIEGLRPTVVEGAVKFEIVAGIVLEMAAECRATDKIHFLLIDELNRANLPRVLGELMYLFEYRDKNIDLPYTRNFSLPPNLYFIATMNTADRNIRSIDIALRRRFDVFMCQPDPDVLNRYYADTEKHINDVPDLVAGFVKLNERLQKELDEHHTIGHAFFMSPHFTPADLAATWSRKIEPLLSEYFFASPDIAKQFVLSDFWPSMAQ